MPVCAKSGVIPNMIKLRVSNMRDFVFMYNTHHNIRYMKAPKLNSTQIIALTTGLFIITGFLYGWSVARKQHTNDTETTEQISKRVVGQIGAAQYDVPETDTRAHTILRGGQGDFVFQKDKKNTYTGHVSAGDFAAQTYPYAVTTFLISREDGTPKIYLGLYEETWSTIIHRDNLLLLDLGNVATSSFVHHVSDIEIKNIKSDDMTKNTISFTGIVHMSVADGSIKDFPFKVVGGKLSK